MEMNPKELVNALRCCAEGDTIKINGTRDYGIIHIGKTVFLTSEEAEKELAEMEGKKDG